MSPTARASACKERGQCVPKCPQQLLIPDLLKQVHSALAQALAELPPGVECRPS